VTTATTAEGRVTRRERLRELLGRRNLGGVVLRRPVNFAWYTGGADSRVDHVAPDGVADILVTPRAELVLASTMSGPRMRAEQTPDIEVVERPWWEDAARTIRELTADGPVGSDGRVPDTVDLSPEIDSLRRTLDPDAVGRLREVGADLTAALAEAAEAVAPGVSESEAAEVLERACRERHLTAPVLLVGGDERVERFRHPLPTDAPITRRALLATSAERGGLYANHTVIVELEDPDAEVRRRCEACEEILGRMRDEATRPGRTLADAFADCRRFYADAGYPDEWKLHHQGGMTGYGSREVIATPDTHDRIESGQAFAWNPSITGAKAEETFVLTESGPEVVTGERARRARASPRAGG
jgi:Xaa-Pro dipeptidase